ncbi:MAG: hypothetical protein MUF10_17805 [Thermoanaerobaculaceae bacterium]|jgi:hypothetical protein|nr:hypothetical protein [Thermoanaerobaculaceae bacterium]
MNPRPCLLVTDGTGTRAEWLLTDDQLVLTLEGGGTRVLAIEELSAVAGDELALSLTTPEQAITLSRLGADASFLLAELRRRWLPARARALRLLGDSGGERFTGSLAMPPAPAHRADFLLAGSTLLAAPHGQDVAPLFLALVERLAFDPDAFSIGASTWDGAGGWTVGMLGGRSEDVLRQIQAARSMLAAWTAAVLAAELPLVSASARAALASRWAPGRLLQLAIIEEETRAALTAWLGRSPRAAEAAALRRWASDGRIWVGITPLAGTEPVTAHQAADATAPPSSILWMLARRGSAHLLEAIGEEDLATYHFEGGDEVFSLVSAMLCAPHFAREAVYMPLADLVGERADLALAARHLPFLAGLRQRFVQRIIHRDAETWRAATDAIG